MRTCKQTQAPHHGVNGLRYESFEEGVRQSQIESLHVNFDAILPRATIHFVSLLPHAILI